MMNFHLYDAIKTFGTLLCSFYIYTRAMNRRSITVPQYASILFFCLVTAVLYALVHTYMPFMLLTILLMLLSTAFLCVLTHTRPDYVIPGYWLSLCASEILLTVSGVVTGLIFSFATGYEGNFTSVIAPISLAQCVFAFLIFRIQRFKDGFPFLLRRSAIVFAFVLSGAMLLLFTVGNSSKNNSLVIGIAFSQILIGAGLYILLKRGIAMFYHRRIKEQDTEFDNALLREKDEEIARLTGQNKLVSEANHKVSRRLAALERAVAALAVGQANSQNAPEYADVLDEVRKLAAEYHGALDRLPGEQPLPATNVTMIDLLFKHFAAEASGKAIHFNVKLCGSIHYMIEHVIPENRLETLLGDHIQNAIIAIDAGDNSFRSILIILGVIDDCYELTIHDSGVEFEIETLKRLGLERTTTHADSGGSGIGFMTTFETLDACSASLIITEKPVSSNDYTKSITIRFDGKRQYKIKTYRPDAPSSTREDMSVDAL